MAHHNFYDSLGLDRGKDAEALGKDIDQRLQSQSLDDATRDELQVARRILGDPGRRKIYDTRLDDPSAPTIDVRALRQMAAADPGSAPATGSQFNTTPSSAPGFPPGPGFPPAGAPTAGFPPVPSTAGAGSTKVPESSNDGAGTAGGSSTQSGAASKPEPKEPKRKKPKQYFPDTDPNAEAVSPAPGTTPGAAPGATPGAAPGAAPSWTPGSYPATNSIPVYQGPASGSAPGQYGFQSHNPGQPPYSYPAPQTGPASQQAPAESAQQAPAETAEAQEKKGASPWLIAAIVLVLLAIAAGGWWLWNSRGSDWSAEEQEMADTFPQIISEKDGQRGWLGMKCTSMPTTNGEEARIRCSDSDLGVSIMDFGTEPKRNAQLPDGDAEVIGNNVCSARSYKMEGVTPPAYRIAPEGADSQYLLVINGGEAESKRMYLNLCEKSRG